MKIADILAHNTRKALGSFTSSPLALQIHLAHTAIEVVNELSDQLERGVVAIEALARANGAKLPDPDTRAAREALARAAKKEDLRRQLAQLDDDGEPDGSPSATQEG